MVIQPTPRAIALPLWIGHRLNSWDSFSRALTLHGWPNFICPLTDSGLFMNRFIEANISEVRTLRHKF